MKGFLRDFATAVNHDQAHERAMIEAHKAGRAFARDPLANELDALKTARALAFESDGDIGDSYLAGYYGERRRMVNISKW